MNQDWKNFADAEALENDAHYAMKEGRPSDAVEHIEKAQELLAKVTIYDLSHAKNRLVRLKAIFTGASG